MRKFFRLVGLLLLAAGGVYSRQDPVICGTSRERAKVDLHLHRQTLKWRQQRLGQLGMMAADATDRTAGKDYGDIAVLYDNEGVVQQINPFDLVGHIVTFTPSAPGAARYRFATANLDAAGFVSGGQKVAGLGDDDTRQFNLPFAFPFYGSNYQQVWLNSDGNLTFGAGDSASTERSLGRMTSGPPRISALFEDLNPSISVSGVKVLAEAARFVVTWDQVPEFSDTGVFNPQTFQLRLYPDGKIEFAYSSIQTTSAVVGISPGRMLGSSSVLSFTAGSSAEFGATVAEVFADQKSLDLVTAAQRFYATHDDAYDYLVIFNTVGIADGESSLASERTIRNANEGMGDILADMGREWGSAARLKSVLSMSTVDQWGDLYSIIPARRAARDTPLSVLGHEAGHLFLAFASVRDPNDDTARPMLGYQNAHWAFTFNSEASLDEGNRIQDFGAGASPRFLTVGVTEGYSPLDQYLMGLRAPSEVPATFLVTGTGANKNAHPALDVPMNGQRRDITISDIIQAEGRRTPDSTVAQKKYRMAFILVIPEGSQPASADLDKLNNFRTEFEKYYVKVSGGRAAVETNLRKSLQFSAWPAAGVLRGGKMHASISLQHAAAAGLTVQLSARNGFASIPASVKIPAAGNSVSFDIQGVQSGVEEVTATPTDASYETITARVQVLNSAADLSLQVVSGNSQIATPGTALEPVVVRVVDINKLPYPGVTLTAAAAGGGFVSPANAVTGADGAVTLNWTPGTGQNQLSIGVQGGTSRIAVSALSLPRITAVVNGASLLSGVASGGLARIQGSGLAGGARATAALPWPAELGKVNVKLKGSAVPLLFVSDTEIHFQVPSGVAGTAEVVVQNSVGTSNTASVVVSAVAPGLFLLDPQSKMGNVVSAASLRNTWISPVGGGDSIVFYATGLGDGKTTVQLQIGSRTATVNSQSATAFPGVYEIKAKVPAGLSSGLQPMTIALSGQTSNQVLVGIR